MDQERYRRLDDDERRVVDDVRKHGWHACCIEPDAEGPGLNYSIGLIETENHPEIIIFGLDRRLTHDIMWGMVHDIRAGRRFDRPGRYEDLIDQYACAVRPVHESQHPPFLGYAMWYMRWIGRMGELEAVQLFWPSKCDGLFPWEDGCPQPVIDLQPLLYLPAEPD